MSTPGRPTLADVAALAGVSLKTASRAMNEEYGVAQTTAERVFAAARELGFRPNRLAQSLAGGGPSAAVGLLIPDVSDPFVAGVVGAVEAVLAARDLQLITASHGNDAGSSAQLASALVERRVDGLIIMSAPGDASYLRADIRHGLMVVAMDRPIEGLDVDTVTVDNEAGAREAVRRLLAAGHRRVAALAGDVRLWTLARRLDGYRAALADAGVAVDETLISTAQAPIEAQAALQGMLAAAGPADGRLRGAPPGSDAARCARCTTPGMLPGPRRVRRGRRQRSPDHAPAGRRRLWSGSDRAARRRAAARQAGRPAGAASARRPGALLLGPGERYVPNVGAVERVGPSCGNLTAPAHARHASRTVREQANDGLVPASALGAGPPGRSRSSVEPGTNRPPPGGTAHHPAGPDAHLEPTSRQSPSEAVV